MKRLFVFWLLLALLGCSLSATAQDKTVRSLIELGTTDNRVMEIEDFIANRIGGRPVGSHALEDAERWVADQFRSWGLEVVVQEVGEIPVGFNRGPWSGRVVSGGEMPLHFGTPTYTVDLARLLADMLETEKYGYYHATNEGGYISWYDFCVEFYRQYGLTTKVIPVTTAEYGLSKAARPFNSRLDKSKLTETGFMPLPSWQDAVARYLKEAEL